MFELAHVDDDDDGNDDNERTVVFRACISASSSEPTLCVLLVNIPSYGIYAMSVEHRCDAHGLRLLSAKALISCGQLSNKDQEYRMLTSIIWWLHGPSQGQLEDRQTLHVGTEAHRYISQSTC